MRLRCSRIGTAGVCPSGLGSQPANSAAIDSSKLSDVQLDIQHRYLNAKFIQSLERKCLNLKGEKAQ